MKEIVKFVIAIIIPTIVIWVWSYWAMGCGMNMTTGITKCSINVSSNGLDIPFITFIFYAVFYGLSILISGYKITKKK